jgi:eukaryotic-like serine/threonine-protein kinase
MALSSGAKLGPYEILSPIGAGGMGEVYRARDNQLDRDVAIKVLPAAVAQHPDRLARFEREAKVLAALNHPNIAMIYGLEDRAIVMELVEGPTLAERLAAGAIPLTESLKIATQIADALEAAHEKGVVHRDLKPANVKVREDGTVKVLDFGLATALQSSTREAGSAANSPTLTMGATEVGVILGTASFMSPEQAAGRPVDRRADIWSFGVVLWEMLTGKRLFEGESVSHTLADVLRAEIDFSKLSASTPAPIRDLLKRCLDRDLKTRLRDIGEARIAIQRYLANPTGAAETIAAPSRSRLGVIASTVAVVTTLSLAALAFIHFREKPPAAPEVVRFTIPLPEKGGFGQYLSLSPDGRRVAFIISGEGGTRLWVRALDSLQWHPLAGTEGADGVPFWSFDSHYIVFWTGGKLKKIAASGGPPLTLCDVPTRIMRGFWTRDNRIVFGSQTGVFQVSAGGGVASPLTTLDPARQETYHGVPALLPDGRHFVFQRYAPGSVENGGVYLASLDAKPEAQGLKRLLPDQSMPAYAPSLDPAAPHSGHLLFVRDNTLMAQPFDAARLELFGDAVPIAEQIATFGAYSVSETGALVYATSATEDRRLTSYDRQGKATGPAWTTGQYLELNTSRDGSRAAVVSVTNGADIWIFEFARKVSVRLTNGPGNNLRPVWSPDGRRIAYTSNEGGRYQMRVKSASGAGKDELIRKSNLPMYSNDWSRDGRFLLYQEFDEKRKSHLWFLSMDGDPKPTPYLRSEFNEQGGLFSPDGRFVAYVSDQSGSYEVYVSSFPDPNTVRMPISHGGGYQPRWRGDGKELLYFSGDRTLMSVDMTLSPVLKAGIPRVLFQAPIFAGAANNDGREFWDIAPDGQHILVNTTAGDSSAPLNFVLNWQAGLKK